MDILQFIREEIALALSETSEDKKNSEHPAQYKAQPGTKRAKQLQQTQDDLESKDPERVERAWDRRTRMEKKAAEKMDKKEGIEMDELDFLLEFETSRLIRALISEILSEALSKKTKATLRKKAEKRGLTPGSVEAEYKKGLAAWGTSGSRPGVSQHAWAMARVNSATPSKDWAVVKKSKGKKK